VLTFRFDPHARFFALLKNAGVVFGGNATSSLIGLVYLCILTRALSVDQFGLFSLFGAYVGVISRLTSFQSWQGLIHYGAHAHVIGDKKLLFNILLFGFLLDLGAGAVGFLVALLGGAIIPQLFGLPEHAQIEVAVAASILLFNWICVPTALLRIYDRFMPQAIYQNIFGLIQLACVTSLWWMGEKHLLIYLAVTAVNNIIGQLCFFAYAMREAHRQGILDVHNMDLRSLPVNCPGIWRFVWTTNLDGMVRVIRDIDIFIVNALLDTRAAALYKIARTLNMAMGKLTGPFYQTIYPELARMVAARNTESMAALMRQASLMLGAVTLVVWLGFLLLGPYFLPLAFGSEYSAAFPVTAWSMAAMVVWGFAQPLSPVMMAMRKPEISLVVHLVTTLAYVIMLALLVWKTGLVGAGVALFLFYLLWSSVMLLVVLRQMRTSLTHD
jgi:O-antigen/teichoic acid export membrane protein